MRYVIALLALTLFTGTVFAAAGYHNPKIPAWGQDNTTWSNATGGSTELGYVYDPALYTWEAGETTGDPNFTVEADVEMWMNMAFAANDIYFHIGGDTYGAPLSQSVGGWLQSNNGMWLFVTKSDTLPTADDMSLLNFKNDILNRAGQTANPIPVKWYCTDSTGEKLMTYSANGNNGQLSGVTTLLDNGTTGYHPFTIRCEITPDRYQPDGHYEMDPVLAASPEL